ncbi:hypothetical protein [Bosea sp. (in: a-proteobacteria)]|jgi:hypothetical protein|uniref:hypothetical protein n=1 Tax=Bosea sp. (in: a-proteobacteria) TaxID=1871050 RepID=UPI00356131F3
MATKKRRKPTMSAGPEPERETTKNVRVTYFVIQSFTRDAKGVSIDEPFQPNDRGQGARAFARLKESKAGVVFFSRTGDPATGDWDDAVIIDQYGEVPDVFGDMMAA